MDFKHSFSVEKIRKNSRHITKFWKMSTLYYVYSRLKASSQETELRTKAFLTEKLTYDVILSRGRFDILYAIALIHSWQAVFLCKKKKLKRNSSWQKSNRQVGNITNILERKSGEENRYMTANNTLSHPFLSVNFQQKIHLKS